jgi:glycosyltransferase involved in cell wall biosynthesis
MTAEPAGTELTMIVTARNRADLVEDALASLAEQVWDGGDWDVVLVDNDSTDHTLEILARWADKMPVPARVVTATGRHDPSHARNVGVASTDAASVAFVDDDDVLAPGYVAAIGAALRDHELVGARHEHALLSDATMARYRGSFQTEELGEIFGVPMVSGGGLACRRSLWLELEGQRPAIGYGGEDADFSLRAAGRGVVAAFVPGAVYHVRLRPGLRSSFRQGRRFGATRVLLYRRFRDQTGARPVPLRRLLRVWAGLVLRVPTVRQGGPRLVWTWQLGRRIGHLQGSLTHRTWYP